MTDLGKINYLDYPSWDEIAQQVYGLDDANYALLPHEVEQIFDLEPASDKYMGLVNAEEAERVLDGCEGVIHEDTDFLTEEEISTGFDDITSNQDLYALDVAGRTRGESEFYVVQLLGTEKQGVFISREGARRLGGMEMQEIHVMKD